jgi:hypothetical protein
MRYPKQLVNSTTHSSCVAPSVMFTKEVITTT